MNEAHHIIELTYLLVISMWGHNGMDWMYMGNQIVLQQAMTEAQCEYLINENMWQAFYSNEFYKMTVQCAPDR